MSRLPLTHHGAVLRLDAKLCECELPFEPALVFMDEEEMRMLWYPPRRYFYEDPRQGMPLGGE